MAEMNTDFYLISIDSTTGAVTTSECNLTIGEYVQNEAMRAVPEDARRQAAAEFYARILANTPPAYRDPWLTNALKEGIETALGLRELPPEQGEQ